MTSSLAPQVHIGPVQPSPETEPNSLSARLLIGVFVAVPLAAAVPVAWGWGLSWTDTAIAIAMYFMTGTGITVGFHRYFTHGSFKSNRFVRVVLAIAGSMAIEGPVTQWVADHRKHHRYSDRDGDPHSPWRYGTTPLAVARGIWHAHTGWLFSAQRTSPRRYAPDLLADPDIARVSRLFPLWVVVSLLSPAIAGGLISQSWQGMATAFFWGTLVRIGLLHHVTWSVNSICHVFGSRPFATSDKSTNVWWLALPSFGESWHNLHHAYPASARHGVLRWQADPSAWLIRLLELLHLAHDVRWPDPARLTAKLVQNGPAR